MESLDRDLTLPELLSEKDQEQLAVALAGILGTKIAVVLPDAAQQAGTVRIPLLWDLETVGYIEADGVPRDTLQAAVGVVRMLFKFAARYRIASEMHDRMVQADYDELREKHAALQRSEARFKALAERLEERVAEQVAIIQTAQSKLYQSEKLASVGRLAAGMAHEINNPLSFALSNLSVVPSHLKKMQEIKTLIAESNDQRFIQAWEQRKLNFVLQDLNDLLAESVDGLKRVAKIVADLKAFSNIDNVELIIDDINERIRTVLGMITPEIGDRIRISLDFGDLSPFPCRPGPLGQVLYNLLLNAVQAIEGPGEIAIQTSVAQNEARIDIRDSGQGIPEADLSRIFDPFFTTKEVGQGTGLGLTVCNDIVKAHGGHIEVESRPGNGSLFSIYLPMKHA